MADRRRQAQRAGGAERSKISAVLPPEAAESTIRRASDIIVLLGETIQQVRTGAIDPRVANTVGYLGALLLKAMDQADIEKRLACLEAAVQDQQFDTESLFDGGFEDSDPPPMRVAQ